MPDSDPTLRAAREAAERGDAVLHVQIRALTGELSRVAAALDESTRFQNEVRVFMAEARASAAARAESEARFRAEDWPDMKSRVGEIEKRVGALEGFRWKILGAVGAAGVASGVLATVITIGVQVLLAHLGRT